MNVQFVTTTRSSLAEVSVVNGQLIYLSDENAAFYDMGSVRNSLTSIQKVEGLPEVGYDGILYIDINSAPNSVHVWNSTALEFVQLIGLGTVDNPGLVQPDGSTIFVDEGVISCHFDSAAENKLSGIADNATKTEFSRILEHGTKIGTLVINNNRIDVFAPTPITATATTAAAGLMSPSDKIKLNGIADNADNVSFTRTQTSGTKVGTITINSTSTDLYAPTPITASATTASAGLMSAADKSKLNEIANGADNVSFTQHLTSGSEVGTITINGTPTKLYAPAAASTAGLVSGVKGNAETSYRVGDVNLKPSDLGIVNATTATAGLMTSSDKVKLNGIASGAEVNVQSDWNVTDSNSDAYIKNKPDFPTIGTGTLTIQRNGTKVADFGANATSNATANITVPTSTSELTNNSGFVTSSSLPTVNNATLTIQRNGTTVKSFTANSATNTTCNITVPTSTSELTNNSGFVTSSAIGSGVLTIQKNGTKVIDFNANASSNATCNITVPTSTSELTNNSAFATTAQIPSVGSGTLTIQRNGTTLTNFSANATSGATCNIAVPTSTSELVNNSAFATTAQLPTVNDATLTIQKNGTHVATFTANSASAATANITVPTSTSELTNNSGFLSYTDVSETLSTGSTAVVLSSVKITTSSTIDVYCADDPTVTYSNIEVAASACTVSFPHEFEEDKTIKIRIT